MRPADGGAGFAANGAPPRPWVHGVLRRLRPVRAEVALGMAAVVATAGIGLLEPWPVKVLVDSVFGQVPAPPVLALPAHLLGGGPRGLIAAAGGALLVLLILARVLDQWGGYLLSRAGAKLVTGLRVELFTHLHRLPLRVLEPQPVGDLGYRLSVDAYAIQSLFNEGLVNLTTAAVTLVGITMVMVRLDVQLTLVSLAVVPLLCWAFRRFAPGMERRAARFDEQEGRVSAVAHESLGAARLVRALDRGQSESLRFWGQALEGLGANLTLRRAEAAYLGGAGLVMAAGTATVLWVGALRVLEGAITVGHLLVFVAYVAMLYGPLATLSSLATHTREAVPRLRRVLDLLAEPAETAAEPGGAEIAEVRGEIAFENVKFSYVPDHPVLRDVSFRVAPGEIVGLVGPTGIGKSTLLHLLLRFDDPGAGRILLDGRDIRTIPRGGVRRQVSLVLQETILFSASVEENIRYGRPEADRAAVVLAAKAAGAHDFIQALPEGYDTPVGERGLRLSAGQRQAIALARALLRGGPILLLDEPTSGLDAEAEAVFLAAVSQGAAGRATILVSHRVSTLRVASRIVVLQDGQVVEEGPPQELLVRGGPFRRLFDLQTRPGNGGRGAREGDHGA